MPVYVYEPDDRDCLMCDGRVDVIQEIAEDPLKYCPHCGMEVRRVITSARIKIAGDVPLDRAGQKGFTTYRRAERGVWERVDGVGPDAVVGTKEDLAAIDAEKRPAKVVDLG